MPFFPLDQTGPEPSQDRVPKRTREDSTDGRAHTDGRTQIVPPASIKVKNRRRKYLELHPEYFSPALELADPLLYDRLIRRFQTAAERETEGRLKGHSGLLEADLQRAEAKLAALAHPDPRALVTYSRGPNGEILAEDSDEVPGSKEEGVEAWRHEMGMRFVRGADGEFEYAAVDGCEELDVEEEREEEERYFDMQEPEWEGEVRGETGVQDY